MKAYYNEFDPFSAQWLRNLSAAGKISGGTVDERSIKELKAADFDGYERVHLFAGIGGWDLALNLARWPRGFQVWTGSCPCQPFSLSGKQKLDTDDRHLWPQFFRLIKECRPDTIFGEQVDNKHGRAWVDWVSTDLESIGYAFAPFSLNSAGIGAPHIRQRIYWVANAEGKMRCGWGEMEGKAETKSGGSGKDFLLGPRPDHRGSSSTLTVSDVCAPSYGIPGRVGRLRGYGNSVDPEVAAQFVMAAMEAMLAAREKTRQEGRL